MEHLLLAPLGENAGDVLSMLFWLNCRDKWEPVERRPLNSLPPVTHLWVITSDDSQMVRRLPTRLIKPLKVHFNGLTERRVLIAKDVADIFSTTDEKKMAELLYRLVLHGECWRNQSRGQRHFSIHLTAGRNAIVGNLQRAATFFEVDHVVQLVFDPDSKDDRPPDDLTTIERKMDQFYPVYLDDEPSPWRPLLNKPWLDEFPRRALVAANFALRDWDRIDNDWIETFPDEDADSLALTKGLKKIAGNTKKFADQALGCGVGPHFLRHDLRKLVDNLKEVLPGRAELIAVSNYLLGLSQIIDNALPNWSRNRVSDNKLPALCDQALILAVGQSVTRFSDGKPEWQLSLDQGEFRIDWEGWVEHRDCCLSGISEQALLSVLRNFLANVWKHGLDDGKAEALFTFETIPDGLQLMCQNLLPDHRLDDQDFLALVEENGEMPLLLQPFLSVPSKYQEQMNEKSDGLGLFTVARTVERTNGAVKLVGPWLAPWEANSRETSPGKEAQVRFYVGLQFWRVTREAPPATEAALDKPAIVEA